MKGREDRAKGGKDEIRKTRGWEVSDEGKAKNKPLQELC
jgi:hypothetical protein